MITPAPVLRVVFLPFYVPVLNRLDAMRLTRRSASKGQIPEQSYRARYHSFNGFLMLTAAKLLRFLE